MKVGDILVFTNNHGYESQYYTKGKHYRIFKISEDFISGHSVGWILDDKGGRIYFKDIDAENENWKYLKNLRKEKLQKINNI